MRSCSFLAVWVLVLGGAAPAEALELPSAEVIAAMGAPVPMRVRITVTRDAIMVRPRGGTGERKVTTLKEFVVPAADQDHGRIGSLSDALEPADNSPQVGGPPPENGVDGWAELWIDRAAPYQLVSMVTRTVGRWIGHYALAVKTPSGERTVYVSLPEFEEAGGEWMSVGVEAGTLYFGVGSKAETAKVSAAAVQKAVAAFEKAHAKGRPAPRGAPGAWVCADRRGARLDDAKCWRGQVALSASSKTLWGEVVPLVVAAQTVIPDVVFPSF